MNDNATAIDAPPALETANVECEFRVNQGLCEGINHSAPSTASRCNSRGQVLGLVGEWDAARQHSPNSVDSSSRQLAMCDTTVRAPRTSHVRILQDAFSRSFRTLTHL